LRMFHEIIRLFEKRRENYEKKGSEGAFQRLRVAIGELSRLRKLRKVAQEAEREEQTKDEQKEEEMHKFKAFREIIDILNNDELNEWARRYEMGELDWDVFLDKVQSVEITP